MVRLLAIVIALSVLAGGAVYFIFFKKESFSTATVVNRETGSTQLNITGNGSDAERIATLEEAVKILATRVGEAGSSGESTSLLNLDGRIKNLESSIAKLEAGNGQSSTSTTTSTTTSSSVKQAPTFIQFLGNSGSTTSQTYATVSTLTATIDTSKYPGYTSMQLQVNLRQDQGNGTGYARLYNSADGTSVLSSEVSSTSENNTWVQSPSFTLPSGSKTYTFQLKTTTGYAVTINDARILVNF